MIRKSETGFRALDNPAQDGQGTCRMVFNECSDQNAPIIILNMKLTNQNVSITCVSIKGLSLTYIPKEERIVHLCHQESSTVALRSKSKH